MTAVVAAALVLAVAGTAGSISWAIGDRAARDAALDEEVDRTLDEAVARIDADQWPDARAAVALRRPSIAAPPAAQRRHAWTSCKMTCGWCSTSVTSTQCWRRMNSAVSACPVRWVPDTKPRVRSTPHSAIMALTWPSCPARKRLCSSWGAASAASYARRLDSWCRLRRGDARNAGPDSQLLVELAKAADPDPMRCRLRDALQHGDTAELKAIAASADVRHLPPGTLLMLGQALGEVRSDQAVVLLRKAQCSTRATSGSTITSAGFASLASRGNPPKPSPT